MYSGQALGCKQKGSNADIAGAVCGEPGAIRAKVREFESAKFKCKRYILLNVFKLHLWNNWNF